MNTDADLLQRYANDRCEDAFAELIARHVDLVYSAALRSTNGDTHRADDITQQVFTELARKANSLAKHPALVGWLYTTTRRIALHALRDEQRRIAREQEAHIIMNEILRDPTADPDWRQFGPVLDAAMHALGENDRLAILLRFFQSKSFNEIGAVLGLRENAARMRVDRALEKLRLELIRKGISSSAVAIAGALTQNAVHAAPTALVAALKTTVAATATAQTASTLNILNIMAVTKSQITAAAVMIIASVMMPLLIQQQTHPKLRAKDQIILQQQSEQLALTAKNRQLAASITQTSPGVTTDPELLRLRAEVASLRKEAQRRSQGPLRENQIASLVQRYSERIAQLKQYVAANPNESIPELRFMTDADWLWLAGEKTPNTPEGYRRAMSLARLTVEGTVSRDILRPALKQFAAEHNGRVPVELSELKPYFKTNLDDSILQRWQIVRASTLRYLRNNLEKENWVITQKAPVNAAIDQRIVFSVDDFHMFADAPPEQWETLQ